MKKLQVHEILLVGVLSLAAAAAQAEPHAEREAFWVLSGDGHERAYGLFNATLRDWGRLGAMLAAGGKVVDRQIVPRGYLQDATGNADPQPWTERYALWQGVLRSMGGTED